MVLWKEIKKQINRLFMWFFACGSSRGGNLHISFTSCILHVSFLQEGDVPNKNDKMMLSDYIEALL